MSCPELGLPNGPIHELLLEIFSAAVPTLHILPHIPTHPSCPLSDSVRPLSVPEPFPLLPAHSSLEPSTLTTSIFLPLGPLATPQWSSLSGNRQVQKFRALPCLLSASAPADSSNAIPRWTIPTTPGTGPFSPSPLGIHRTGSVLCSPCMVFYGNTPQRVEAGPLKGAGIAIKGNT